MSGTFEPGDFITIDVDVDLWFCSGCLFLILDRDQEESTDGEKQRRTISLAFLSVLKRIALETKVSSWAYEWKVRTTADALGIYYDHGRMVFLVDVEKARRQALNPLTDTCKKMEEDGLAAALAL